MIENCMFHVILERSAKKQFRKLRESDRGRVLEAIKDLAADPYHGKKLQGDWEGHYAVRVWPYRIVYTIDKDIVTVSVVSIAHRKDVYR